MDCSHNHSHFSWTNHLEKQSNKKKKKQDLAKSVNFDLKIECAKSISEKIHKKQKGFFEPKSGENFENNVQKLPNFKEMRIFQAKKTSRG